MNRSFRNSMFVFLSFAFTLSMLSIQPVMSAETSAAENGKKVAFDRRAGNCLSCHLMENGEAPGNLGPPLVAMKARFPDREKLRDIIWDITTTRPEAMMPPFGRHNVISEKDIDDIVEYLYTL